MRKVFLLISLLAVVNTAQAYSVNIDLFSFKPTSFLFINKDTTNVSFHPDTDGEIISNHNKKFPEQTLSFWSFVTSSGITYSGSSLSNCRTDSIRILDATIFDEAGNTLVTGRNLNVNQFPSNKYPLTSTINKHMCKGNQNEKITIYSF